MWIRPSMPSRSTKAPKSTMFEIAPSTTCPGWRRSRICWRTSLRSSSSTARRDSTTLLRERFSSMTLHSIFVPRNSSRFWTRRMSTSEAGRKPRTPRSMIRPPLTTSITVPSTGSPDSAAASMLAPGLLEAGALLGQDQPAVLVLLGEDQRVDLLAQLDLVVRVDRLADRELVERDDALALVADVDQDLVLVDPDDLAGHDVALLEGDDGRVVVGDDLAVDLEQQSVRALDGRGVPGASSVSVTSRQLSGRVPRRWRSNACSLRRDADPPHEARRRAHPAVAATYDVLICGASFAGLAVARELRRQRARGCWCSTATRSASARPRPAAIPTEWLRALGLDGLASARPSAELVVHTPHATVALRAAVDLLDLRLPRRCARCSTPRTTPSFETAKVGRPHRRHGPHRPRRPDRAADRRRRPRLAARARRSGYQPPDAPLSRGLEVHPCGRRRRPRDLDRPPLRARRLRLELPGRRGDAHRRRLVRPALPRQGHDGDAGRGPRARRRSATRATGSRTGCAPPPRTASSSSATRPATACR